MTNRPTAAALTEQTAIDTELELPSRDALQEALEVVISKDGPRRVQIIERTAAFFSGTFPNEVIRCRIDDDPELELFFKYSAGYGANSYGHRGSVEYEALVYEQVLAPVGVDGVAKFYGAYREVGGAVWLITECFTDFLPLTWLYDPVPFGAAAGWAGRLHALYEKSDYCETGGLTKYDPDYYTGWVARTASFGGNWRRRYPWLTYLCKRFEDVLPLLLDDSVTVIHGEFYGKNVLLKDDEIFVVDWESAAVGVGEIDLAAITEGWPEEWRLGTEDAYKRARWPSGTPAAFERRLDAARMYLHLRWLGDRPEWTNHPNSKWRFDQLHHHGERLGLL